MMINSHGTYVFRNKEGRRLTLQFLQNWRRRERTYLVKMGDDGEGFRRMVGNRSGDEREREREKCFV